jgi:hypothetical protein
MVRASSAVISSCSRVAAIWAAARISFSATAHLRADGLRAVGALAGLAAVGLRVGRSR